MNQRSLSISGVAHDLNNQIMIVFHSLDWMLRDYPNNPELGLALKAIGQCAKLTAQLLPHTKKDAGWIPVRQLIDDTASLVRSLLPPDIRLDVDCEVDCLIPGIPDEVQQALVNLCLNAMQAMRGPGVIRLSVTEEQDFVSLCVSDTGPGVPLKLREQIFHPLFTTRAHRGGHGLGLARVRETVGSMGGTVDVCDAVPTGACFRIRLPLAAPSATLELAHLSD